jgi:hypothetical protein
LLWMDGKFAGFATTFEIGKKTTNNNKAKDKHNLNFLTEYSLSDTDYTFYTP